MMLSDTAFLCLCVSSSSSSFSPGHSTYPITYQHIVTMLHRQKPQITTNQAVANDPLTLFPLLLFRPEAFYFSIANVFLRSLL